MIIPRNECGIRELLVSKSRLHWVIRATFAWSPVETIRFPGNWVNDLGERTYR